MTIRTGFDPAIRTERPSAEVESPHTTRCPQQFHRSPGCVIVLASSPAGASCASSVGSNNIPWISNGERGQRQIEIKCLQFLQLEGDQFQIEGGPSGGTVRCKPERFYLRNGYAARNSSRSRLNVTRIASVGCARIGR